MEFDGNLDGGGDLDKEGNGTLRVTGANTYTGTTDVNAGTLIVNGTHTGAGNYVIASGATLGGTGSTTGATTVNANGTIAPGDGGVETLGTGDLDIDGIFDAEVNGVTTPGTDYDQIEVTGTVDVDGGTLNLSGALAGGAAGDIITLISNDGGDAVTGIFSTLTGATDDNGGTLADGDTITFNGEQWKIFYAGGDGNDVVLASLATPGVIYVDDLWGDGVSDPANGTVLNDADFGVGGNQGAVFGINAFATLADAIAAAGPNTTIILNDGDYSSENISLTGNQILEITGPDAAGTVTVGSINTVAGTTIAIEGTSTLNIGDAVTPSVLNGQITSTGGSINVVDGTVEINNLTNDLDDDTDIQVDSGATLTVAAGAADLADFKLNGGTLNLEPAAPVLPLGGFAADLDLALWLDASDPLGTGVAPLDGTVLTTWEDKSINNRDASNVIGNPIFVAANSETGSPAVQFTNDMMWTDFNFNGLGADYTVLAVSRYTGGDNERVVGSRTENYLHGHHGNRVGRLYENGWIDLGFGADTQFHTFTAVNGPSVDGVPGGVPLTDWFVDGAQRSNDHGGANDGDYKPGQISVGGGNGNIGERSNSEVAQLVIFNRALSEADRLAIENWFAIAMNGASADFSENDVTVCEDSTINIDDDLGDVDMGVLTIENNKTLNVVSEAAIAEVSFSDTIVMGGDATINLDGCVTVELNTISETAPTNLVFSGEGTVVLPTANTYTGTTTVQAETILRLGNNNSLGTTANGTTIESGGALDLNGADVAEPITISGTGTAKSPSALFNTNAGDSGSLNGQVTLDGDTTVGDNDGGRIDIRGVITDNGNGHTLTKIGNEQLWTWNTADYQNLVVDPGSNYGFGAAAGLPDASTGGTVSVGSGAALNTWGSFTVSRDADITFENGSSFWNGWSNANGAIEIDGTITLNGAVNFNSNRGDMTTTINSEIDGAGGIVKNNDHTLVLTNNDNSFTGTNDINAGTVLITADNALGDSAGANAFTIIEDGASLAFANDIKVKESIYVAGNGDDIDGDGNPDGAIVNQSGRNRLLGGTLTSRAATEIGFGSLAGELIVDPDLNAGLASVNFYGDGDIVFNGDITAGGGTGIQPGGLTGTFYDFDGANPDSIGNNDTGNSTTLLLPFAQGGDFTLARLGLTPSATVITPRVDFGNGTQTTQGDGSVLNRGGYSSGGVPPWQGLFNNVGELADMDGDHIAGVWTGQIEITTAGNYTFTTRSDDGSVLFINGQEVVDNNNFQGMTNRSGTVFLAAGMHDISIGFYEGGGGAGVQASYSGADTGNVRVIIPPTVLYNDVATAGTFVAGGLRGDYYDTNNPALNGGFNFGVDEFLLFHTTPEMDLAMESLHTTNTRFVTHVDFGSGTEVVAGDGSNPIRGGSGGNLYGGVGVNVGIDNIGSVFDGFLLIDETANYQFAVTADDRSRVFLDLNGDGDFSDAGELVATADYNNGALGAAIALNAGDQIPIKVVTSEGGGGARMTLSWQNDVSINARTVIGPDNLGVLDSGSSVTKHDGGTLTLAGNNTFTSPTNFNAGTTIIGDDGTNGTLSTGDLTVAAGATLEISFNDAGTLADTINVTGTVDVGGTLAVDVPRGTTISNGTTFTIVANDDTEAVGTLFAGLAEGDTVTSTDGLHTFTISYAAGSDTNDIVLTALDDLPDAIDDFGDTSTFGTNILTDTTVNNLTWSNSTVDYNVNLTAAQAQQTFQLMVTTAGSTFTDADGAASDIEVEILVNGTVITTATLTADGVLTSEPFSLPAGANVISLHYADGCGEELRITEFKLDSTSPYKLDEDTLTAFAGSVLDNDIDPDGDIVITTGTYLSTLGATVTVNLDGSFSFDPRNAAALQALGVGDSIADTFTYTITDADGNMDTATVTVIVCGLNDDPKGGIELTTDEDTPVTEDATDSTFNQQGTLTVPPATLNAMDQDRLGQTVRIDGDIAVVGGIQTGVLEDLYIYRFDGASWNLEQRLVNPDGYEASDDNFGQGIAIDSVGGQIFIGADRDDRGAGNNGGVVHIYSYDAVLGAWELSQTIGTNQGLPGLNGDDEFGYSIDVTNDGAGNRTLVVGARVEDAGPGNNSGAAYVFDHNGANWGFTQRITASDEAGSDEFGFSVAIDGESLVVGARLEDTGGGNTGSAYVFQLDSTLAVGSQWIETELIRSPDSGTSASEQFGYSVDISGDTVVVGAFLNDTGPGNNAGRIYVFTQNVNGPGLADDTWTLQQTIAPGDVANNDRFGISVAIEGDTIIAGSQRDNAGGEGDRGAAYVFTRAGVIWSQSQKIVPSDENDFNDSENFGHSVSLTPDGAGGFHYIVGAPLADVTLPDGDTGFFVGKAEIFGGTPGTITSTDLLAVPAADLMDIDTDNNIGVNVAMSADGNTAVVGAPQLGDGTSATNANRYGAVLVYTRNPGDPNDITDDTWTLSQTLFASNRGGEDQFGRDVGISHDGSTIVVGAFNEDSGGTDRGSAYVFELNAGTYTQVAKLNASDGANDDEFGYNVAINEDGSVIGINARLDDGPTNSGAVYVFHRGAGWVNGTEDHKIKSSDIKANDRFGRNLAISGNRMVVGSRLDDFDPNTTSANDTNRNRGSVYVFEFDGVNWTETQRLTASDSAKDDQFGLAVDIHGDVIVVGSELNDGPGNSGSAYVFRFDSTTGQFVEEQILRAGDAQGDDRFGRAVAVFGDRLIVGAHQEDTGGSNRGAAYVFEFVGGTWTQTQKLQNEEEPADIEDREFDSIGANFGLSVDIGEMTALVGAPNQNVIDDNGTPDDTSDDFIYRNHGAAFAFELAPFDKDAVDEVFTITAIDTQPTAGIVSTDGTNITFDPDGQFEHLLPGETEIVTFTYTIEDSDGGSSTVGGTVTVTGVNDAPVAANDPMAGMVTENGAAITITPATDLFANDDDPDDTVAPVIEEENLGGIDTSATEGLVTPPLHEIGEISEVNVSNAVSQVTFTAGTYTNPVIIAQVLTANEPDAVVVRISNIDAAAGTFDAQLGELSTADGLHGNENVRFIIMEAGTHVLEDGTRIEVGTLVTDNTSTEGGLVAQNFSTNFQAAPTVLSQVQTLNSFYSDSNNPTAGTLSLFLETEQAGVSTTGFQVGLDNEPGFDEHPTGEVIGYIAIEMGSLTTAGPIEAIDPNGTITYDPNGQFEWLAAGESTTDTFVYTVRDKFGLESTAVATIVVKGENDVPVIDVANSADDQTGVEGTAISITDIVNFDDLDLTDFATTATENWTINVDWGDGTETSLDKTGTVTNTDNNLGDALPANGTLTNFMQDVTGDDQVPAPTTVSTPNEWSVDGSHTFYDNGTFTVTVTVDDGNGGTATHTFEVVIDNVAPTAVDDNASTDEDNNLVLTNAVLVGNDTDPANAPNNPGGDADPLVVRNVPTTSEGGADLSIDANGNVTFDPTTVYNYLAKGESATDTFTYWVTDGDEATDAQVMLDANNINPAATSTASQPAGTGVGNFGTGTSTIRAVAGNLTYPGYNASQSGGAAQAFQGDYFGYRATAANLDTGTSLTGEVWFSFLVQNPSGNAEGGIAFNAGNGGSPNQPFEVVADGTSLRVDLPGGGGSTIANVFTADGATTHLVVGRMNTATGEFEVWVDPDLINGATSDPVFSGTDATGSFDPITNVGVVTWATDATWPDQTDARRGGIVDAIRLDNDSFAVAGFSEATVTVTVNGVNDAPVAVDDAGGADFEGSTVASLTTDGWTTFGNVTATSIVAGHDGAGGDDATQSAFQISVSGPVNQAPGVIQAPFTANGTQWTLTTDFKIPHEGTFDDIAIVFGDLDGNDYYHLLLTEVDANNDLYRILNNARNPNAPVTDGTDATNTTDGYASGIIDDEWYTVTITYDQTNSDQLVVEVVRASDGQVMGGFDIQDIALDLTQAQFGFGSYNDTGVFDNIDLQSGAFHIDEDSTLTIADPGAGVLANDFDPDASDTISVIDFDARSANGATVVVNPNGTFTYDPRDAGMVQMLKAGETLIDTFTYTIQEAHPGAPVTTPGADLELNAGADDGLNNIWEDLVPGSPTGFEGLRLDNAPAVTYVTGTSSIPGISAAYDFPGGSINQEGGAHLVRPGETTPRSFSEAPGDWSNNDISLEMWFKPDNLSPTPANGQILFEDGGGGGLGLFIDGGFLVAAHDSNQNLITYDLVNDPLNLIDGLATDEFIQVVVTHDVGAPFETRLYVNGTYIASSNDDGDWSGGDAAGFGTRGDNNVGGRGGGQQNTESFDGQIAVIRAYTDQLLTDAEVQDNYDAMFCPPIETDTATVTIVVTGVNDPVTAVDDKVNGSFEDVVFTHGVTADADGFISAATIVDNDGIVTGATLNHDANGLAVGTTTWDGGVAGNEWVFGPTSGVTLQSVTSANHDGITQAFVFDGTGAGGAENRGINDITGDPSNNSGTFEFWVKPDNAGADDQILFETGGSGIGSGIWFSIEGSTNDITTGDGMGTIHFTIDAGGTPRTISAAIDHLDFQHVVATHFIDPAPMGTDSVELFINGQSVGFFTDDNFNDFDGGDIAGLGNPGNSLGEGIPTTAGNFQGALSVFRFYEQGFTEADALQNYKAVSDNTDIDGDDIIVTGVAEDGVLTGFTPAGGGILTLPSGGTVSITSTGQFTYDPTGNAAAQALTAGETITDTFYYQVTEDLSPAEIAAGATATTSIAQVTICIHGRDDAVDDTFTGVEEDKGSTFTLQEVIGNDNIGSTSTALIEFDASFENDDVWNNQGTSGNGFDAMLNGASVGTATSATFGGITQAYTFNGASNGDNGLGNPETLPGNPTDNDATFEIVFQPDAAGSGRQLLFEGGGSGTGLSIVYDADNGQVIATIDGGTNTAIPNPMLRVASAAGAVPANIGDFVQVVVVYNRDNGAAGDQLQLYLNNAIEPGIGTDTTTSNADGFNKNEAQIVNFGGNTTGHITLSFGLETTADIDIASATLAADIETALELFTGITDVRVSGDLAAGVRVEFVDPAGDVAQMVIAEGTTALDVDNTTISVGQLNPNVNDWAGGGQMGLGAVGDNMGLGEEGTTGRFQGQMARFALHDSAFDAAAVMAAFNDLSTPTPSKITHVEGAVAGTPAILASGATVILNSNGSIDYTPGAGQFDYLAAGEVATDTFTYSIDDGTGTGGTDTATITVVIRGENDPVTANDDNYAANEDDGNANLGNVITTGPAPFASATPVINEIQPNPPGGDPATQSVELLGNPGDAFNLWLLSIENDGFNGTVDRATNVTGTFDANGLATVTVPDLENPSFTLILTDTFTGTAGTTDIDPADDGVLDLSTLGTVLDALGVSDATADDPSMYGAVLGGTDILHASAEPELVFRDGVSGDWYAVRPGGLVHDAAGTALNAADFNTDPTAGVTFGAANPTTEPLGVDTDVDRNTVVFEDFSGTGGLNGTRTGVGGATWVADTEWNADGTKTVDGHSLAFIPFAPVDGQVYTLSLTVDADVSATTDWFALGFSGSANVSDTWLNNQITGWMLIRENDGLVNSVRTFEGTATGGTTTSDHPSPGAGPVDLQVVLNTTVSGAWTYQWFADGVSLRGPVNVGTPTITHAGFGAWNTATGTVDNFALTQSPGVQEELNVISVNGSTGNVGVNTLTTNHGVVNVASDGTFNFNPNGEFEYLDVNESVVETFTYLVADQNSLTDDLDFHITFGETADAAGNLETTQTAIDISGNGRDGSFSGDGVTVAAATATDPIAGDVLNLAGSDDFVNVDGYTGVSGDGARTISAWIKTNGVDEAIVSYGENNSGEKFVFRVQNSNGVTGAIRVEINGGAIVGSTIVNDGEWHHVAFTFTGGTLANGTLFVDGEAETLSADLNNGLTLNTSALNHVQIGNDRISGGRDFTGMIDDVGMWSRALTADEIANIYHAACDQKNSFQEHDAALVSVTITGQEDAPDTRKDDYTFTAPVDEDSLLTVPASGTVQDYSAAVLADNPLVFWQFGDVNTDTGETTANTGTAGATGDGTYIGTGYTQRVFDGPVNGSTGINIGNGTEDGVSLDFSGNFPTTAVSFEGYFRGDAAANSEATFFSYESSDPNEFLALVQTGTLMVFVNGVPTDTGIPEADLLNNEWNHLAVSWDSTTGNVLVFVNGELRHTATGHSTTALQATGTLIVGWEQDGINAGFNTTQRLVGDVAEVALYGSALTQAQIAAHLTAQGVLTNDTDVDASDTLTVIGNSQSALGAAVTVAADGSFTYDPRTVAALQDLDEGQSITDTFTYTVTDATVAPDGLMAVQVINTTGTNPGNNTANWLNVWDAIDGGATTGTIAGFNVVNNTSDTEVDFNYEGAGNFGGTLSLESINGNGPGGAGGPFSGGSNYSVRANGFLEFTTGGTFTIAMGSDDGRRIEFTEAFAGSAPGFGGFTSRAGQVNGTFAAGDNVVGFSGGTGHNWSLATFTVAAGDILALDAFYYEGGGGDSGEIAIGSGTLTGFNTTDFSLLSNGVLGINLDSSDPSVFDVNTVTETVCIKVTGVNDAPVAVDDLYTVNEDDGTVLAGSNVTGNDFDPDSNPPVVAGVLPDPPGDDNDPKNVDQINGAAFTSGAPITLPSGAILTMNTDGSFTYNPNGQFEYLAEGERGYDEFTYRVNDDRGDGTAVATDVATVRIVILGQNDDPEAEDDHGYVVLENGTLTIDASDGDNDELLYNDSDTDTNNGIGITSTDTSGTTGVATIPLDNDCITGGLTGHFIDLDQNTDLTGNRTGNQDLLFQPLTPYAGPGQSDFVLQRLGLTPTVTRIDATVDFTGNPGGVDNDQIAATWTGEILITNGGDYTFRTESDDGSVLFINGVQVVNNNKFQGTTGREGTINLTPGRHIISIGFYEGGGGESMDARYSGPDNSNTMGIIPTSVLFSEGNATATGDGLTARLYDLNNATNGLFAFNADELLLFATEPDDLLVLDALNVATTQVTPTIDFGSDTRLGYDSSAVPGDDGRTLNRGGVGDTFSSVTAAGHTTTTTNIPGNPFGAIGVNVGSGNIAAIWEGYIRIPEDGTFEFTARSDDHTRVYIDLDGDGTINPATDLIVSRNAGGMSDTTSAGLNFTKGFYKIHVYYGEGGGDAGVQLSWEQTAGTNPFAREIIPGSAFAPEVNKTSSGDGSFDYDPNGQFEYLSTGQSAIDTFEYTITDSDGGTDTATAFITILGQNDAPIANDDVAQATEASGAFNNIPGVDPTGNVTGGPGAGPGDVLDTDVDALDTPGTTVPVTSINFNGGPNSAVTNGTTSANGTSITGNYGTLTIGADGTYKYVVDQTAADSIPAGGSVAETFNYTITDSGGLSDTATLTVIVNGSNENPVAEDNSTTVTEDSGVPGTGNLLTDDDGLDTNHPDGETVDFDLDGDPMTVTQIDGVTVLNTGAPEITGTFGTLDVNTDGSYTYDLDDTNPEVQNLSVGETLTESFVYTVQDSNGATDTATMTVTVQGTNDMPGVSNLSGTDVPEQGTTVLTGTITEQDGGDDLTVTIDWDDPNALFPTTTYSIGNIEDLATALAAGGPVTFVGSDGTLIEITGVDLTTREINFKANHLYPNDGPNPGNGTMVDVSQIEVTVDDGQGGVAEGSTDITVTNISPTNEIDPIPFVERFEPVIVTGSYTDPGPDAQTVTIDWNDPHQPDDATFDLPAAGDLVVGQQFTSSTDGAILTITGVDPVTGEVSFSVEHIYPEDGIYEIEFTFIDADGGQANGVGQVEVYFLKPDGDKPGFFSRIGALPLGNLLGLFQNFGDDRFSNTRVFAGFQGTPSGYLTEDQLMGRQGSGSSQTPYFAGIASPGASVTLEFRDEVGNFIGRKTVFADTAGNWNMSMPGAQFSGNPYTMIMTQAPSNWSILSGLDQTIQSWFNMGTYLPQPVTMEVGQIVGQILSGQTFEKHYSDIYIVPGAEESDLFDLPPLPELNLPELEMPERTPEGGMIVEPGDDDEDDDDDDKDPTKPDMEKKDGEGDKKDGTKPEMKEGDEKEGETKKSEVPKPQN